MRDKDLGRRAFVTAGAALAGAASLGGSTVHAAAERSRPIQTIATRTDLAALRIDGPAGAWLCEKGREGLFLWRSGDFRAALAGDRYNGLYLASQGDPDARSGCWVREWDNMVGRPEWFGAVTGDPGADCLPALEACAALCQTVRLGPHDYHIHDSWQMGISGRNIIGSAGSGSSAGYGIDPHLPMGTADGTRVILSGARAVDAPVFIFGKRSSPRSDDMGLMRNAHLRDIKFARDCSARRVRPSLSDDPLDSVKGVVLSFFSDCSVAGIRSYDSPVGFQCVGVVYSTIRDCMARRSTPATSKRRDFWVGWLIGGYGDANYGYIGANASIYLDHCSVFDSHPDFDLSIGLKLFGRIADSFINGFEMARLTYGVVIDGSDEHGVKMSNVTYAAAHQDVTFNNPVLDGYGRGGFVIRNLQDHNCIDIVTPYAAGGGLAMSISDAAGNVAISGGKFLSGGIRVRNVNGFTMTSTLIRDAPVPVELDNVGMFRIEANIFNFQVPALAACVLKKAFRGKLAPQIRGAPGLITYGVVMDGATDRVSIDESAIDPGCFVTVDSANKVRYNNADAHRGAGTNILTGTI